MSGDVHETDGTWGQGENCMGRSGTASRTQSRAGASVSRINKEARARKQGEWTQADTSSDATT